MSKTVYLLRNLLGQRLGQQRDDNESLSIVQQRNKNRIIYDCNGKSTSRRDHRDGYYQENIIVILVISKWSLVSRGLYRPLVVRLVKRDARQRIACNRPGNFGARTKIKILSSTQCLSARCELGSL